MRISFLLNVYRFVPLNYFRNKPANLEVSRISVSKFYPRHTFWLLHNADGLKNRVHNILDDQQDHQPKQNQHPNDMDHALALRLNAPTAHGFDQYK